MLRVLFIGSFVITLCCLTLGTSTCQCVDNCSSPGDTVVKQRW